MDGERFDNLARQLSSRRTAIGGLAAGLLLPLDVAARGKGKDKQRKRTRKQRRASAQGEPCWRTGACIVKKGSNVSQCDLADYEAPEGLDCTRCNLSRANLRGADLTGVNFTRANLSGACLVDADFTGATFTNSTNLYGAIFCNTTMPDGSVENSGCDNATPCCPTGCQADGDCGDGQFCCNEDCVPCPCSQVQLSNGSCAQPCTSEAQCPPCGRAVCQPDNSNPAQFYCLDADRSPIGGQCADTSACPQGYYCYVLGSPCVPLCT